MWGGRPPIKRVRACVRSSEGTRPTHHIITDSERGVSESAHRYPDQDCRYARGERCLPDNQPGEFGCWPTQPEKKITLPTSILQKILNRKISTGGGGWWRLEKVSRTRSKNKIETVWVRNDLRFIARAMNHAAVMCHTSNTIFLCRTHCKIHYNTFHFHPNLV